MEFIRSYIVKIGPEPVRVHDRKVLAEAVGVPEDVLPRRQLSVLDGAGVLQQQLHTAVQHFDGRVLRSQVLGH